MLRILAITNNPAQASFRVRLAALAAPLRERGIALDVRVRPRNPLRRRALLRTARGYDGVLLQRKLLDATDARTLRRAARWIAYDVDDAVMYSNRPKSTWDRWLAWRRFLATAGRVDVVVAGNAYLAELFERHGAKRSVVIPTVVDPSRYQVKRHEPQPAAAAAAAAVRLVWIGSRSTLPYLDQLRPALADAARRVPDLRLVTIADQTLARCPLPVEHLPWSADTEAASLVRGDIGIGPTPEDRWTLGKCGFKLVQYMAAGLPVIASPVGANARIVLPGETGLLPEQLADWPDAIARLAADVKLRAAMGAAGRARAEQVYSVTAAADAWAALAHEALSPHAGRAAEA